MAEIFVTQEPDSFAPNRVSFEERKEQLIQEQKHAENANKREKSSPFSRWTQFNNERTKELMNLALRNPKAHAVLYFLVDQMDEYNAVMVSYKVIQEVLGVGRTTASQAIKILKEHGFIAVLRSGTSNIYAINDSIYWKSWGNNKQYSKFPANVVLSLAEQEESLKEKVKSVKHKEIQSRTQK